MILGRRPKEKAKEAEGPEDAARGAVRKRLKDSAAVNEPNQWDLAIYDIVAEKVKTVAEGDSEKASKQKEEAMTSMPRRRRSHGDGRLSTIGGHCRRRFSSSRFLKQAT